MSESCQLHILQQEHYNIVESDQVLVGLSFRNQEPKFPRTVGTVEEAGISVLVPDYANFSHGRQ